MQAPYLILLAQNIYIDKIVLELFKCINTNNDAIQNNVL